MATPAPYTALCGKTCTGTTAWMKSLDTGYCYKALKPAASTATSSISTYCAASPGTNIITGATLAHVKSELENAGNIQIL